MRISSAVLVGVMLLAVSARAQESEVAPPAEVEGTPPEKMEALPPALGQPTETDSAPAYDMKLRELEERVVGLKEKIFKSKTRLLLLREQILHSVIAEARAVLFHKNDMGSSFTLEQVLYYLDNDKIYYQDNKDGALDKKSEFEVFNGNVVPGNHLVSVELVYRGNGTLFSYIDGYLFKIRSNYTFYASKGRVTRVKVVGYERGGMTTDLEQKPYVKYEVQQFRYSKETVGAPEEAAPDGAPGDVE